METHGWTLSPCSPRSTTGPASHGIEGNQESEEGPSGFGLRLVLWRFCEVGPLRLPHTSASPVRKSGRGLPHSTTLRATPREGPGSLFPSFPSVPLPPGWTTEEKERKGDNRSLDRDSCACGLSPSDLVGYVVVVADVICVIRVIRGRNGLVFGPRMARISRMDCPPSDVGGYPFQPSRFSARRQG